MFEIGKEGQRSKLSATEILIQDVIRLRQQIINKGSSNKLPIDLLGRYELFDESANELRVLTQTVPSVRFSKEQKEAYGERTEVLVKEAKALKFFGEAMSLGFDVYSMPESFWVSTAYNKYDVDLPWFKSSMPQTVVEEYEKAKKTGFFNAIFVGSIDRDIFDVSSIFSSSRALVGYVSVNGEEYPYPEYISLTEQNNFSHLYHGPIQHRIMSPGIKVKNAVGFLIAKWGDTSKDS